VKERHFLTLVELGPTTEAGGALPNELRKSLMRNFEGEDAGQKLPGNKNFSRRKEMYNIVATLEVVPAEKYRRRTFVVLDPTFELDKTGAPRNSSQISNSFEIPFPVHARQPFRSSCFSLYNTSPCL
jgi:hypothetical protein